MQNESFRPQVVSLLGENPGNFEGGDPYLFEFTS